MCQRSLSICFIVPILCLTASAAQAALTAAYTFDESSGNTAADSIRGAPAVGNLNNFGGTQWVPGKIGNAVEFDGANDYILALNAVPTGTTAFTVSAWVWADSAPTWGSIVKNWGGSLTGAFHLGFNLASGQISNYVSGPAVGPALAPAILSLSEWHHIALVYNGGAGSQTLYIDGVPAATAGASASLVALSPNMAVGVKTDNSTTAPDPGNPGYWDGKIDDLAFWNEPLSDAAVLAIKTNGDNGIGVVPEPASASLLLLSVLAIARRRK